MILDNIEAYTESENPMEHVPPVPVWPPPWLADFSSAAQDAPPLPVKPTTPASPMIFVEDVDSDASLWDNAIPVESVTPCSKCDSLEFWEDFFGNRYCQRCQPNHRAHKLVELAAGLRRRHNWQFPPGVKPAQQAG
jgi:hypothetical protein